MAIRCFPYVSVDGDRKITTGEMPAEQKARIIKLVKDIKSYYPSITTINGYKELAAADCPGKNYPLDEVKALKTEESSVVKKETLRIGKRGDEVMLLQKLLIKKGCNPGLVDGIFGAKTEKAVKEFQTKENIGVDGIVGPITWVRLEA